MFALRRLRIRARPSTSILSRTNATVQPAVTAASTTQSVPTPTSPSSSSSTAPASSAGSLAPRPAEAAAAGKTKGRRTWPGKRNPNQKPITRRAPISVAAPRKWNRPIAPSVLPAYDEALKVIRSDAYVLRQEVKAMKKGIREAEEELEKSGESERGEIEERLEKMREKLEIVEVQSEINLPEVRWRVRNAMVDMSKPSHRRLLEQRWRGEGKLDLLMERIHQMNVVPDVLPVFHPSFDLHLTARLPFKALFRRKRSNMVVEPGKYLLPEQTLKAPSLYANVFHTDTRLYTLLLVDPDVPDEDNQTFTTYLHWMQPNIPLSAAVRTRIQDLNEHTKYIPPHPQRGTPYHRYTLLLLPQPPLTSYSRNATAKALPGVPTSKYLDIPVVTKEERLNFNVREFVKQWGLNAAKGGGGHMWREVWDETVSGVYKDILGREEPKFGLEPKYNPYAELKDRKRYV